MEVSQLRRFLKFRLIHRIRQFYWKRKLGRLGVNVFIDKNVEFLRFTKNIFIGDNVVLKEGTKICSCNQNARIYIGNNTTIGYYNFIFASENIEIGNDCLIAPFVYIVDSNHNYELGKRINQQKNSTASILIKSDVWIASNVTILKGLKIDEGAVIAAGSVVNSDIEGNSIYGGSPAKKIGERK